METLNLKPAAKIDVNKKAHEVEAFEDNNLFKIGSEYYDAREARQSSTQLKQNTSHLQSQSMVSLSSGQASFRDLCPVDKERLSALIQQVAE